MPFTTKNIGKMCFRIYTSLSITLTLTKLGTITEHQTYTTRRIQQSDIMVINNALCTITKKNGKMLSPTITLTLTKYHNNKTISFSYHNKEQWKGACSSDLSTKTLTLTKLGKAKENIIFWRNNTHFVPQQETYTFIHMYM